MIIETIKYDPQNPFKPFIFIGNKLNPKFLLPKDITAHSCFKLADLLQVEAIKHIVKPDRLLSKHSVSGNATNIYEYDFVETKSEHGYSYTPIPLLPKDYKYWVVELSENLADPDLVLAIYLLSKTLTVIAQIGSLEYHINHNLISAIFYSDANILFRKPLQLDDNDIKELTQLYILVKGFKSSAYGTSFIGKALQDYHDTLDIEYSSPFKIIALFSLIETLLTSNQNYHDTSINRQLQKKLVLVNNQLSNKINFFEYFKGPESLTEEIIIEKLYYYRSKIAHGDYYDFRNDLQILIDHNTTFAFLTLLFKRILIFSMSNPTLISDLREC